MCEHFDLVNDLQVFIFVASQIIISGAIKTDFFLFFPFFPRLATTLPTRFCSFYGNTPLVARLVN